MSVITTINSTDLITNSRTTINTNFSNLNADKVETSYLDTDTTLAANSDVKIATQKAVKAYIDSGGSTLAPTGAVMPYAGSSAPTGWLLADGSAVSRSTYATLFAIVSTTYGAGNGTTTFNVPNLKGKIPVGLDAAQTEFDALAETGGAKTHTLIISEMPAHTHNLSTMQGGAATTLSQNSASTPQSTTTSSTGGDGAHQNLQPYIVLQYIIKT